MTKRLALGAMAAMILTGCGAQPAAPRVAARPPALSPASAGLAAAPEGEIVAGNAARLAPPTVTLRAPNGVPEGPTAGPVTLPDGARYMAYAAAATPDDGADVKVVTFNTAVGNPKIKTPQSAFPSLPFYAATIDGAADAPILCLQEVGNDQRATVAKLAETHKGFSWRYQRVGLKQGNMMLIPSRYTLEKYDDPHFGFAQVKAAGKLIVKWIGPGAKPNLSQLVEPRGFQIAWLRDTRTGRRFVVVNTHVSYYAGLQEAQAKRLFDKAFEAAAGGPLIVAGDLNARTADTDDGTAPNHAAVRGMFRDLADMGPAGRPPSKTNIDWVLARGFSPVRSRWYTGTSISLPGSPDALTVSDHYAEEDVLRWN